MHFDVVFFADCLCNFRLQKSTPTRSWCNPRIVSPDALPTTPKPHWLAQKKDARQACFVYKMALELTILILCKDFFPDGL